MSLFSHDRSTGFVTHSVMRRFSLSRLLTLKVRKIYERRYKAYHIRHRYLFVFDAFLIGTMLVIFGFLGYLWMTPSAPPEISVVFSAPQMDSGKLIPAHIRISSIDERAHENVRVQWHFSDGVQIIASSPQMYSDGTVYFGRIEPGQEYLSQIQLIPLYAPGDVLHIGFRVEYQDSNGRYRTYYASEERPVISSVIETDILESSRMDAIVDGAFLPVRIFNGGSRDLPFVELRSTDEGDVYFDPIFIGDISAGQEQIVYLPLRDLSAYTHLSWAVYSMSREIVRGSDDFEKAMQKNASLRFDAVDDGVASFVFDGDDVRGFDLIAIRQTENGFMTEVLPAPRIGLLYEDLLSDRGTLHAILLRSADDFGSRTLLSTAIVESDLSIPVSALSRYTTASGDQIGLGPNPPHIGEETRYWVFWSIGPVQSSVRDIVFETSIADGATLTGNVTAPDGGVWSISGDEISWNVDSLLITEGETEALFGFEVAIRPTGEDMGSEISLTGDISVSAVFVDTDSSFETVLLPVFSEKVGE